MQLKAFEYMATSTTSTRRCALITGASAGIGAAFARLFAEQGFDVLLVARRRSRLEVLATELEKAHGITAHIIVADLSKPDAPEEIFARLRAEGWHADVLVNNAGIGLSGLLRQNSWPTHRAFIELMAAAPVHLAYLAEAQMRARGWGRIINVASLAAFTPPAAGHTLYNAVKAFLVKFSQSHAQEVRGHGIFVTALCPGFTWSEFHDVSGTRHLVSQFPNYMWMSADDVARAGFEAVMAGRVLCIPGRFNRAVAWAMKYAPDRLAQWLTRSQTKKYRLIHDESDEEKT